MPRFMYRGQLPVKIEGETIRFGETVDGDHPAVKNGYAGFFPIRAKTKEEAPETPEEAASIEPEFDDDPRDLHTL